MNKISILSATLILGLLIGAAYSQATIELQVKITDAYNTQNNYLLAAQGIFGGKKMNQQDQCSQSFTIQTNKNQFTSTNMVLPNARRCGDVSNVSLGGYATEISLGGINIPLYLRYDSGDSELDFSDADQNIANIFYTQNKVKNPIFYFNLKKFFELVDGFQPKSYLYIGDYDSSVAQASQIINLPKLGDGLWQFPLKNIIFQGNSYQVSDQQPFEISSYDSVGLGQQAYLEFLKPLVKKRAIVQNKKFNYISIKKDFLNELPDITLQVKDIHGNLQNLNIPAQNYVVKVKDEYILKIDNSNQVGYPLYYNYLIGFDRIGKQFLLQQKQDSQSVSSF
ncbi:hypothetical protein ABPG72_004986 [Tetrahymena utriculariae]